MIKFKLAATIPAVQYGNLVPEFEVEAETYPEAVALAEAQLIPFWNKYVEAGKELKTQGQLIEGFCGGSIYYDPVAHVYTNDKGEVYLSSSNHAKTFAKDFDRDGISAAMAKKHNVNAQDLITMWELKGKISRDLGTALHEAIELRRRFEVLSKATGKDSHIHLSPLIKQPVDELMELLPVTEEAIEAVVIDHDAKRVGRIDLIYDIKGKTCEVVDFKTGELGSKLDQYWEQLKFTANILAKHGWQVRKLKIYHYDGTWKLNERKVESVV